MSKKPSINRYKRATEFKTHNKRVVAIKLDDGIGLLFRIKDDINQARAVHEYKRGITETSLKISEETAKGLYLILHDILNRTIIKDE